MRGRCSGSERTRTGRVERHGFGLRDGKPVCEIEQREWLHKCAHLDQNLARLDSWNRDLREDRETRLGDGDSVHGVASLRHWGKADF